MATANPSLPGAAASGDFFGVKKHPEVLVNDFELGTSVGKGPAEVSEHHLSPAPQSLENPPLA